MNTEAHNEIQKKYYESRKFEENWRNAPRSTRYVNSHVDRFLEFADLHPDDRILDIGCGMGKFTIPIAQRGFELSGLDLSSVLLETLLQNGGEELNISTYASDILNPPKELFHEFNKVIGFFMLHHMADIDGTFEQAKRLLKPGGKIFFLDVNPLCLLYYLQIFLSPEMRWRAEKGILNLTNKKITIGLIKAGFSEIQIKNYGILPPVLKNRNSLNWIDHFYDEIPFLKPFAAFKLISATLNVA